MLILFYFAISGKGVAQQALMDSLKQELVHTENDTVRLVIFGSLANLYSEAIPDSSYRYADAMLGLARKMGYRLEEAYALGEIGYSLGNVGNYPRSLQTLLSAISIAEDPASEKHILPARFKACDEFTDRTKPAGKQRMVRRSKITQYLANIYGKADYHEKALFYIRTDLPIAEQAESLSNLCVHNIMKGRVYMAFQKNDSALRCFEDAYEVANQIGYKRLKGSILLNIGRIYLAEGKEAIAKDYFRKARDTSTVTEYFRGVVASHLALADVYRNSGQLDSALHYARSGLPVAYALNAPDLLLRSFKALTEYYTITHSSDSTVKYQALIIRINDSLFNSKQAQQFQNIDVEEQQRQQQIEAAQVAYRAKFRTYLLLAGLAIFSFIALILWRSARQRKLANELLSKQKAELESTVHTLRKTQSQLVQSEKMASLGELTAGIAHEIQNPLNFVNNFSEVNKELIGELKGEADKGNLVGVKSIASDLADNEEKIIQHGRRADAIVKSMLQHSRTGSTTKEPTDINKLVEKYARLVYHSGLPGGQGRWEGDKEFKVSMELDYDPGAGQVTVMPQEIGKVLINLLNNAFYAVAERARSVTDQSYTPRVRVSTRRSDRCVSVTVTDNGNGIPEHLLDKIFQPFFTTKPAGQGTGLGLSLSYDIITKGHGGEFKVSSAQGGGASFEFTLPA